MQKLLLVDGSNLLFQMFYGMPSRINGRDGHPVQGTLGFIGALSRMCTRLMPTHVCVVFDGETHNPRKELDAEYKANRPDYSEMAEEETPFSQLPDIFAALSYMRIPYAETEECEADDWIAAYARALPPDTELIIASQDSDFFQLIGERVRVLRYRGENSVLMDTAAVEARCGVPPYKYAAWKSLVGDHADNIRGVRGVGPKTAAALLAAHDTLDGLLASTETLTRPAVREALGEAAEDVRRNYALIRLDGCHTVPFSYEAMRFTGTPMRAGAVLSAIGAW